MLDTLPADQSLNPTAFLNLTRAKLVTPLPRPVAWKVLVPIAMSPLLTVTELKSELLSNCTCQCVIVEPLSLGLEGLVAVIAPTPELDSVGSLGVSGTSHTVALTLAVMTASMSSSVSAEPLNVDTL